MLITWMPLSRGETAATYAPVLPPSTGGTTATSMAPPSLSKPPRPSTASETCSARYGSVMLTIWTPSRCHHSGRENAATAYVEPSTSAVSIPRGLGVMPPCARDESDDAGTGLDGPYSIGGSATAIANDASCRLPLPSVAVHDTTVVPYPSSAPGGGVHSTGTPRPRSVAVGRL